MLAPALAYHLHAMQSQSVSKDQSFTSRKPTTAERRSPDGPGDMLAVLEAGEHSSFVIAELTPANAAAPPTLALQTDWVAQPFMIIL